jgi:drug/metabolite transporter (DMT)-like permease
MVLGVILGFVAAACNSVAYLFSRAFLQKHHASYFHLLAVSHVMMGVVSVALAAFLWPAQMPGFGVYGPSLLGAALFYLGAQACLFLSFKNN